MSTMTLEPNKKSLIALPGGHQMSLTGIEWAHPPTRDEVMEILKKTEEVDFAIAWANGDAIVEYVKCEQYARPRLSVLTALLEYSHFLGKQVDTVKARYSVARHYAKKHRLSAPVYWSHHHLLWSFGMSVVECIAWLRRAEAERWSVSELRAAVKQAKRPAVSSEPKELGFCPDWLRDAIDHASGCLTEIETMPEDTAQALLAEAEPLAAYIDALRARVAASVVAGPSQGS
jgi:hypothetical protein